MIVTESELKQTVRENQYEHGTRLDSYFAWLYIAHVFRIPPADVAGQVEFDHPELGISAFHYDSASHKLNLYHAVWSEDHRAFQEGYIRLITKGMERIFQPDASRNPSPLLGSLRRVLAENREEVEQVSVNLIYNGSTEETARSGILEALQQHLERKAVWIDRFFAPRKVNLGIEYHSNGSETAVEKVRETFEFNVRLGELLESVLPNGVKMYMGFLRLLDLHQFHETMEGRLLSRNIRLGLPPATPPNRAIRESLENIVFRGTMPAQAFAYHHNGITLHVEGMRLVGDQFVLTEPRLVNGAQTVSTLDRFLRDHKDDPELRNNWSRLRSIPVIAKIVTGGSDEFLSAITISTNKQNPVHAWNLRANDIIQLRFADKFKQDLGLFYARQEGRPDIQMLQAEGFPADIKPLEIKRMARTFLALRGRIDGMQHLVEIFEKERLYVRTFDPAHLRASAKAILLAYKIQLRLGAMNRAMGDISRHVRYLTWTLLIQALFNLPNIAEVVDRFGGKLEPEPEFVQLLEELTSGTVLPLVMETMSGGKYPARAEAGDYRFLDTPEFFNDCLLVAYRRLGWKHCEFPAEADLASNAERQAHRESAAV